MPPEPKVPVAVQARGLAGDAATVVAKWALMGALMVMLPAPWSWVATAITLGAMAIWGGVKLLTHLITQDPDRYEANYHVLLGRIDFDLQQSAALRRKEGLSPHERAQRYQKLLNDIRGTLGRLEEMKENDPSRVLTRGALTGLLFLPFAVLSLMRRPREEPDREVLERYEREDLVRKCRSLVDRLPKEMPALPPAPEEDEGGYRVLPARFRVDVPQDFRDFEDELETVADARHENKHQIERKR